MIKNIATAAAIAASTMIASSASAATDHDLCTISADMASWAMGQRMMGVSPQAAGANAGGIISDIANQAPFDFATRKAMASILASEASYIISMVYTFPLDPSISPDMHAEIAGVAVYRVCMNP